MNIEYRELLPTRSSLGFSSTRGKMQALNLMNEDESAIVFANAGAQLMNSPHYLNRFNSSTSYEIVKSNEKAVGGSMLAFTRPQDMFTFTSDSPSLSSLILSNIARFYEAIHVGTTHNFYPLEDVEAFPLDGRAVIPQVLSPELLLAQHRPDVADANVAFYKKHISDACWKENGIPVTPSAYFFANEKKEQIQQALQRFSLYDSLVFNRIDGSGGYGINFIPNNDALEAFEKIKEKFAPDDLIRLQGKLPLLAAPTVHLNVADSGEIEIIHATKQLFHLPGEYGGSIWTKELAEELSTIDPHFFSTIVDAAQALQRNNVRGQVNLDAFVISKEDSEKYEVQQTIMQEANIRPGGSSVFARMRQEGVIEGRPITRILSNNHVLINTSRFLSDTLPHETNQDYNMRCVVYNFHADGQEGVAHIAFLGNDSITISDLEAYEKDTLCRLHTWR